MHAYGNSVSGLQTNHYTKRLTNSITGSANQGLPLGARGTPQTGVLGRLSRDNHTVNGFLDNAVIGGSNNTPLSGTTTTTSRSESGPVDKISALQALISEMEEHWRVTKNMDLVKYLQELRADLAILKSDSRPAGGNGFTTPANTGTSNPTPATIIPSTTSLIPAGAPNTASPLTINDLETPTNNRTSGRVGQPNWGRETQNMGHEKSMKILPPEGFVGIHASARLQNTVSTMSAVEYLGQGMGLDNYYTTIKKNQMQGLVSTELAKLMIFAVMNSWETQRKKWWQTHPNLIPTSFNIQLINARRSQQGLGRMEDVETFPEFLQILREEYIDEDVIRSMITGIQNSDQGERDLDEYVGNFCKQVEQLQAIAPQRMGDNEILHIFMHSLSDNQIRRAIATAHVPTFAAALMHIGPDITEVKRNAKRAHQANMAGSSARTNDQGLGGIKTPRISFKDGPNSPKASQIQVGAKPIPAWASEESDQVYAFRMLHNLCFRCGSAEHKANARPGYNDPSCPLKRADRSLRGIQQSDRDRGFTTGLTGENTYQMQLQSKRSLDLAQQSVASHSRLQKK